MGRVLYMVITIILLSFSNTNEDDFDFIVKDEENVFDFYDDLSGMVLAFPNTRATIDAGESMGISLEALDKLKGFANNDLVTLLDELKGYHQLAQDGSDSPESGGTVFGGFGDTESSKVKTYEKVIEKLEAIHGIVHEDVTEDSEDVSEQAQEMVDLFDGESVSLNNIFSSTRNHEANIIDLLKRLQYLKDTFHKVVDHCENNPCENGNCVSLTNSYRCDCDTGFEGDHCETAIDYCENKPCINGNCISNTAGYSCNCHQGYEGNTCEIAIDYCENKPCINGNCVSSTAGYSCDCHYGYEGDKCERAIDYCASNPCINGNCVSSTSGYNCNCQYGYEGDKCEIATDYCANNPCKNGKCITDTPGYHCQCYAGYQGNYCEKVDYCENNPCKNGNCVSLTNGYGCDCDISYEGKDCETGKIYFSCKDLRNMNPDASDGEYWLYPMPFLGNMVKIYCHDMKTLPKEYVTLKAFNRGNYPNLSFLNCQDAGTEEDNDLEDKEGSFVFGKVRVNIENMNLITDDYTFAHTVGKLRKYGEALDCYTNHYNGYLSPCGTKGFFEIDTSGTGMIISETTEWKASGSNPYGAVKKSDDYYKIRLDCGGGCGGCLPTTPLVFTYKEQTEDKEWERFPRTCADHKNAGNASDGAYYVYPPILNGVKVLVHCHQMSSSNPKEYISLKYPNVGENPNKSDRLCEGTETVSGDVSDTGKSVFSKVRVNIHTMSVEPEDYTFASNSGMKPVPFGYARDKYAMHYDKKKSKCGPVGMFDIDMRGTGLKVEDELIWLSLGSYNYGEWTRENDNATVHVRCGGWPGSCKPFWLMVLVPNPNDIYT